MALVFSQHTCNSAKFLPLNRHALAEHCNSIPALASTVDTLNQNPDAVIPELVFVKDCEFTLVLSTN